MYHIKIQGSIHERDKEIVEAVNMALAESHYCLGSPVDLTPLYLNQETQMTTGNLILALRIVDNVSQLQDLDALVLDHDLKVFYSPKSGSIPQIEGEDKSYTIKVAGDLRHREGEITNSINMALYKYFQENGPYSGHVTEIGKFSISVSDQTLASKIFEHLSQLRDINVQQSSLSF